MSSLILRDSPMRSIFENFFNDNLGGIGSLMGQNPSLPSVNIAEHNNEYEIELAAPGYNKDSFNIEVQGNNLIVSASNKRGYGGNESDTEHIVANKNNVKTNEGATTKEINTPTTNQNNRNTNTKDELQRNKSSSPERYHRKEFSYSAFERSMYLPENVNTDQIKASYENGILNITIPKREETRNFKKVVEIQ